MIWQIITASHWKPHAVPITLADALVAEMHERGVDGDVKRELITDYGLDRGGMMHRDRPIETFHFAGLKFSVPSEYVEHFHDELESLTPRKFGARVYYKLHCHWNCLVLLPELRRQLLRSLARRIDEAEARATAFYADRKPTNVVLAEIANRHGGNCKPEDMGPDRQARFRKKARAWLAGKN